MSDRPAGDRTDSQTGAGAPPPRPADPHTGTEPRTARSPLRLRRLLAGVFLPLFVAAAVLFAIWAARTDPGGSPSRGVLVGVAVGCAALALTAALDLVVVARRLRRRRTVGSSAP